MTTSSKPILYNGFKVRDGLSVKNRIERIFFTDIYELSDGSYLYLFVNLNPNEVVDRSERYDILRIKNETEYYIGVIVDSFSKSQVSEIKEDLTSSKGFECIAGMDKSRQAAWIVACACNPAPGKASSRCISPVRYDYIAQAYSQSGYRGAENYNANLHAF